MRDGAGECFLRARTNPSCWLGCAALSFEQAEEFADEFVIPKAAFGFMEHGIPGLLPRQGRLVGTGGDEGIVDIDDLKHARQNGNIVAFKTVGISRAVPVLVMLAD